MKFDPLFSKYKNHDDPFQIGFSSFILPIIISAPYREQPILKTCHTLDQIQSIASRVMPVQGLVYEASSFVTSESLEQEKILIIALCLGIRHVPVRHKSR
jgi:hypothetical protein